MIYRTLGRTGIRVSAVAFGAGPVSGLMTGSDHGAQLATVQCAIEGGINWFDTAPGYGNGQSEANLGRVLAELGAADRVHVATKVRVPPESLDGPGEYVRRSVEESLARLRLPCVTLLQLHNGMTPARGDEPAAITPRDVLAARGVAEAMTKLRDAGLVKYVGLTGTGHPEAMREVVRSGAFDTIQVPFNILNMSAGVPDSANGETDYGNIIADCEAMQMGVFAIRVFAGGALLEQQPSAHTLKTPYFPLALYERDLERTRHMFAGLATRRAAVELALRFALQHPAVNSAIIGLGSPSHVDEISGIQFDQPFPPNLIP
jgi:aryl-alcohol dehydrogenase-like predicted oxidoreductase